MSTSTSDTLRCPSCGTQNRIDPQRARDLAPVCGQCGAALPAAGPDVPTGPLHVTEASFERDVEQAGVPVLVDLWAPWCAPCRMIAPTLEAIALEMAGRVRVVKVNIDENPAIAARLGVHGIPTLVVYKDGREVDRLVGVQPKQTILRRLEALV